MLISECLCVCPDGSDSRDKPKLYRLQHSITEVGSDCMVDGAIQVTTPQKRTQKEGKKRNKQSPMFETYNSACENPLEPCIMSQTYLCPLTQ